MTANWLILASAVVLGVSIGLLAYAVRQGQQRTAQTGDETPDSSGDTVRCPACGATNEQGYRYCQECLEELPSSASYTPGSTGTQNRPFP